MVRNNTEENRLKLRDTESDRRERSRPTLLKNSMIEAGAAHISRKGSRAFFQQKQTLERKGEPNKSAKLIEYLLIRNMSGLGLKTQLFTF